MLNSGAIMLMISAVAAQILGSALLPRTEGFTNWGFTLACLLAFGLSFWACARLVAGGLSLGIVVPLIAASVPLGSLVISLIFYGESASPGKIAALVTACALVGLASRLG